VRLTARGATPEPEHLAELGPHGAPAARTGAREVFWGDGWLTTPVYDGERLAAGATIEGPALIEERFTVVAVPPDWTATLADHTAFELRRTR